MELEKISIPQKPLFTFSIDILDVALRLRINDIPVFVDHEGGEANFEVSVNEYMLQGKNTIQFDVLTVEDEEDFRGHSECNITLCVRSKDAEQGARQAIWIMNCKPAELSTIDLDKIKLEQRSSVCSHYYNVDTQISNLIAMSSEVEINHVFPKWAWLQGDVIENNDENYASLLRQYREIHANLQKNNAAALQNYSFKKAEEFAKAYHLPSQGDGETLVSLASEAQKDGQKLHQFWEKGMKLDVYGNGRLARIVDAEEDGPIVYLIGDRNAANILKLSFYKDKSNGWTLIR